MTADSVGGHGPTPGYGFVEQEWLESWIMTEVERGATLPRLYPPNVENKAPYGAWRDSAAEAAE